MAKILKDGISAGGSIDPSISLDVLEEVLPDEADVFDFDAASGDGAEGAVDSASESSAEKGKDSVETSDSSDPDLSADDGGKDEEGAEEDVSSESSEISESIDATGVDGDVVTSASADPSSVAESRKDAASESSSEETHETEARDESKSSSLERSTTERDVKPTKLDVTSAREEASSTTSSASEFDASATARAVEAAEKLAAKAEERAERKASDDSSDADSGMAKVEKGHEKTAGIKDSEDSIETDSGKDKVEKGHEKSAGRKDFEDSSETETAKPKVDKGSDKSDAGAGSKVRTPSEYKTGDSDGEYIRAKHGDDMLNGHGGDDFIKAGKGEDVVYGNGGDDVLDGGHGNDRLDGGAGNDVLNADKGDDVLIYTLGENKGSVDYYDGGKGTDSLVIRMTSEEYAIYEDELNDLATWISENADDKKSSSKQFNDSSASSPAHPVYETSFGLHVRHMEDLQIEIIDAGPSEPTIEVPEGPSEVTATVTGDGAIPLKNVDVSLTKGSQITLDIDVTVDELPAKYDVFMLHDLSGSFWDDLPNVRAQFSGLYDALSATGDVAFGVGSFVDKPMETFGSSLYGDYVYNTDMAMSQDKDALQSTLDGLTTGWGYDWAESQMEALVQTALRDEEIGFRDGAQKFAVLFTDAAYHKEGDYSWAAEGANDYDTEFEAEDYPDPAVVGKMLVEAGITPIFAVTEYNMASYQELVDSWGVGSVTLLSSDSSNIADAITSGLADAPINLELDALGDDYGFVSSIEPPIYEDVAPGTYTFSVTLEIPEESESYSSDSLTFEVTGYGEVSVSVDIESIDITGDSTDDVLTGDAGPNGIYGMDGNDMLVGTGGIDHLFGGNGDDYLVGGLGDDEFTGGAGSDVFVFEAGGGIDTVTDFSTGDLLDFRRVTSVSTHAEVLAAATQVGADTVFDLGGGDSITLLGITADDIQADDLLV